MNKYLKGFLICIFIFFTLSVQIALADNIPMIPAVYLGDDNQAAIVLDNRSTTPTGYTLKDG